MMIMNEIMKKSSMGHRRQKWHRRRSCCHHQEEGVGCNERMINNNHGDNMMRGGGQKRRMYLRCHRQSPSCSISLSSVLGRHHPYQSFQTFLFFLTSLLLLSIASAQDSNHYFCGTSWADASDNCSDRQHCQSGTDDECEVDGHICFGGTMCDVREGHGNAFKYANVAYGDISNTRFCGVDWGKAIEDCSIETHCPSGFSEECPDGQSCYGGLSQCNVQDMVAEAAEKAEAEEEEGPVRLYDKHSPKRKNFCGMSWGDANEKCSIWCPEGEDTDCPGGMGCFGNTGCYYDYDLVPTGTPIRTPSLSPSTIPPVAYKDPKNVRFCGITWALAVTNCSPETHCPEGSDDECEKGETCHGGITQCNILDLALKAEREDIPTYTPTLAPISKEDPSNSKFCGSSWTSAKDNCSLETHCPDDQCPEGEICYGGIGCNAAEMTAKPTLPPSPIPTWSPTLKPTAPTLSPTSMPTTTTRAPQSSPPTVSFPPTGAPIIPLDDPRHSFWCGKDWADVTKNCHEPCISGQDTDCPGTMKCMAFTPCRPATPPPTNKPTTSRPTTSPTFPLPTATPTEKRLTDNPVTDAPTNKPSLFFFTMRPTNAKTSLEYKVEESIEDFEVEESIEDFEAEEPMEDSTTDDPAEDYAVEIILSEHKPAPLTSQPTGQPSPNPTTPNPSRNPTKMPTNPPQIALPPSTASVPAPSQELIATIGSILVAAGPDISNDVLISIDLMTKEESPTQLYQYSGFINALGVMSKGDIGSTYFYLGPNGGGPNIGLANIALFLGQAASETVQFDVCDEISWEKDVFGKYPIANSCGQGRFGGVSMVPYEDANPCSENEAFMACDADAEMRAVAETHGVFVGAPPPLECFPSTTTERFTGAWDPSLSCQQDGCSFYDGQTMGNIDPLSIPTANSFGTKHPSSCCWWGRGAFPRGSAGRCMIGKLNYYLGKRAFDEGRASVRFKEVDFCKDPSAICRGFYADKETNAEIRWLMGMMFWTKVQSYNDQGWSYMEKLHEFVAGGLNDVGFLDDVSRIVSRGCHDQSRCGNSVSASERRAKFNKIIDYFGKAHIGTLNEEKTDLPTQNPTPFPSRKPTLTPTPKPSLWTTPSPVRPINPPAALPTNYPTSMEATSPNSLPTVAFSPVRVETSSPMSIVTGEGYKLTAAELAQRLNYENNYCASNLAEAKAKCATSLRTCNAGDPPCAKGLFCHGNVACSIIWSDIEFETSNESPSENLEESPPESDSFSSPISCNGMCLRPLTANECIAGADAIASLPDCLNPDIGEMCLIKGSCAGRAVASNCPGGREVFLRILSEDCSTSITDAPSTDRGYSPLERPTMPPTISYRPSSLIQNNNTPTDSDQDNSKQQSDSSEEESFSGPFQEFFGPLQDDTSGPPHQSDSRPGAWWIWNEVNSSKELPAMPIMPILGMIVLLVP